MPSDTPTPDLSQELKAKQDDLKTLNTQLSDLQAKATGLRTEVQSLDALVADLNRTVTSYKTDSDRLAKDKKAADDGVAALAGKVGDKVKARKDDIDKAIADQEKTLADQSTAADTARKAAWDARAAATKAADDAKSADAKLLVLKNSIQVASQTLTDESSLLKQAETQITANNAAGAYFLLNEAATLKVTLPLPDDLAKSLDTAQQAAIKAKTDAAASDAAAAAAETQSKAAQQALTSATAARRATIVAALKPLN
jgi:chromosome segregation ATPase